MVKQVRLMLEVRWARNVVLVAHGQERIIGPGSRSSGAPACRTDCLVAELDGPANDLLTARARLESPATAAAQSRARARPRGTRSSQCSLCSARRQPSHGRATT